MLNANETDNIGRYVTAAYLLNPYLIFNCVAMTTTVFANVVLSVALLSIAVKSRLFATLCTSLASHQSFYPIMLLVPIAIATTSSPMNEKEEKKKKKMVESVVWTSIGYLTFSGLLLAINYQLMGSWRFIESTYGCM